MKRILIAIAVLYAIVGNAVYAYNPEIPQNKFDIYEKYKDHEKVSAIYISPMMFGLISTIMPEDNVSVSGTMAINGTDISMDKMPLTAEIIGKLKGLYLIATEDNELAGRIGNDVNVTDYRELMTVRDRTDRVGFFYKSEDDLHISELLMTVRSDGEFVVAKMESDSLTMTDILVFAKSLQ